MLILICFLLIAPFTYGQTPKSYIVGDCSSHCRKTDKDLSCWRKTFSFFEQTVAGEMQNFVITQTNIANWNRQKDPSTPIAAIVDQMEKDSIASFNKLDDELEDSWNDDEDNERDVLLKEDVEVAVKALMGDVRKLIKTPKNEAIDSFCPVPCETPFAIWRYLFFASAALNAALAVAVVPFVFMRDKKDHDNSSTAEPLMKT